jgi:hypothetical protein
VTSRVHYTPASKRSICGNNLKQIGLALHNYHRDHGTFPPAYVPDNNGQPSHSWRVLILTYPNYGWTLLLFPVLPTLLLVIARQTRFHRLSAGQIAASLFLGFVFAMSAIGTVGIWFHFPIGGSL